MSTDLAAGEDVQPAVPAWRFVLSRADGWYVQVGYGDRAGTRPGWYALERRDGGEDRHFRTETSDIHDVVKAFLAFLDDDPALVARFAWRPWQL